MGKTEDADRYATLAESIRDAYNRHLFDPTTGLYASGSQTAQSAPLYFGIVDPEQRNHVLAHLVANVEDQDNHLDTGVVGIKFLLNGLVQHGRADVAYRIVSQTTFPSWGDWIRKGANTLWQKWDDSMSRNHIMFGDVSAWMFKNIGGLRPNPNVPGFKHFFIHPEFFPDLDWATIQHQSPYGPIYSTWRRKNDRIELQLDVPVNSHASVCLPSSSDSIMEGDHPLSEVKSIEQIHGQDTSTILELGSGRYHFSLPDLKQQPHQPEPGKPVRVIFDTDMGSDCDDVGALALLHAYADQKKVEIIGCVYSSGESSLRGRRG